MQSKCLAIVYGIGSTSNFTRVRSLPICAMSELLLCVIYMSCNSMVMMDLCLAKISTNNLHHR